ncbi:unnamed protein product [Zymoseptoria tritici ST99CH_3D7]|uniref:Zn(2)-C6 fungal-type domain-containing protein n=1 Tax=Zymoseptoria tritici (strain ST99CH_3D7) TaxID=1276538 RepID=A0A1X7S1N4_ZYMT9|nr:unnamed protein product [Zymoseptoria tritici ST99CH_3D7]
MPASPIDSSDAPSKRRRLDRVTAACDLCKARKVKCDGTQPCAYCQRKKRADTCAFSTARPQTTRSAGNTPGNASRVPAGHSPAHSRCERPRSEEPVHLPRALQQTGLEEPVPPPVGRDDHHEDTVVPLEARLLRDAQGKVIFVGDCAPLSFLQTVRHLIASEVDPDGFTIAISRDAIIEVARPTPSGERLTTLPPTVDPGEVHALVTEYLVVTTGLADLFEGGHLNSDVSSWARSPSTVDPVKAATYRLVLAIGIQEKDEARAEAWFKCARDDLLMNMCGSMTVATVQGFTLIALYMLRAFQPNGAYLYFSLAARTAYAIGLHRTEVNASFGASKHATRDRIWKTLRVVDMLISNILGRPPSASDVDCTVKYSAVDISLPYHILDSSVQIFMIIERVVVEVYSRKRISIRIAKYVSQQMRAWASKWLRILVDATCHESQNTHGRDTVVGACQILCSYYYCIMLLTRPFLIYDLYECLGASLKAHGTQAENEEKRKFSDAALEAAASFVETLRDVIAAGKMPLRMPLIVSWLFTTSLVLAVGVLGRSGLAYEESCKASIQCIEYFAEVDPHARQYVLIVQSLIQTTTKHVKERESRLRSERKQASSQLFGILPSDALGSQPVPEPVSMAPNDAMSAASMPPQQDMLNMNPVPEDWTMYDADFFALPWLNESDVGLQDFLQPGRQNLDGSSLADIPLFPMYDQMGGSFGDNTGL